ncbi:MAG: NUDIX domain-containing protein [Flavobacteriaceae bacterium]|jgi:ADP-ribose pyrophosphatase YjhB (NUDIX family)|nr:NUDIX domain-containing protein [Flavobacteriaceae bacterium]MDG1290822.1 NUDIX domain-containing protein [Flavobacteriaceae bacterium]MDG1966381.1 NUDIX domain-containing protein [Flavobacteriaceae bacterium]
MYKVFFNRKFVILTTKIVEHHDEAPLFYLKYINQDQIISALKSKKVEGIYLYHPKEEKLWKHMMKRFPLIEAAGGLVKHHNGKILFIYRNKKWDLPKGRIEKKEMLIDGAVREVMEETGVKDLIVKKNLTHTFHIFSRNGHYKLKKTYWYLMTTSYDGILAPQLDEGIALAAWKKKKEIPQLMQNAYENIKLLLKEIELY